MRKLLPVLLVILGLAGGVGAGLFLKPAPDAGTEAHAEASEDGAEEHATAESQGDAADEHAEPSELEFVKLNNQFIVPVVDDGRVTSLVVMSISLQVTTGTRETVFAREPKLRDSFLQVLFDHANVGGFNGTFTTSENLRSLRAALLEAAQKSLGDTVSDVLIIDLVRQDS